MGVRLYGALLGLAATLAGLCAGELVAGMARDSASPVVPVGQAVIDRVPPGVKDWAIDTFGTADKAVLILGTLAVLGVVGSLVGVLAATGRRSAAQAIVVTVGLVGVLAVVERPDPTVTRVLPAVVGTAVSAAALWWLTRPDDPAPQRPLPPWGVRGRREVLVEAGVIGLFALVAAGVGRMLRRRYDVSDEVAALELPPVGPTDAAAVSVPPADQVAAAAGPHDFGLAGVTPFVVANDDFYRIDTALVVPQVRRADWRLRIHGMVARELELTFDDVVALPQVERPVTLSCVSNPVGGRLVGNAVWQGALLAPLLAECGPHPDATQLVSRSVDGWTAGSPTAVVMDGRDALLAIGMNGEPLPPEHGYPARLVVPGLYGYVSATKWVTEIELVRWEDFDAYWVPRGWSKLGPVKTMSRIDRESGGYLAGVAWSVHRGISRVEVTIDGGEWHECELAGVPSADTWRQWRLRLSDLGELPDEFTATVRAYDGAGEPQPAGPRREAPDGAEGYHQKRIRRP